MDKVKRLLRGCAAQFSLARLLMAIVLLALAFAVFAHIKSQQIGEEYKLRIVTPDDLRPVAPKE